jgi:predicted MPP superfamily phosphohydrolase
LTWRKFLSRCSIICIAVPILSFGQIISPWSQTQAAVHVNAQSITEKSDRAIVFISDTQLPLWIETLFLETNHNNVARDMLFHAIRKERNLTAVFDLGDLNGFGSSESDWKQLDSFVSSLRGDKIELFPLMGNHDYMLFPSWAVEKMVQRFSVDVLRWRTIIIDSLAVVMLNSNFSHLSEDEKNEQARWYQLELDRLENNASVAVIIVTCHHSPYTNSSVIGPSEEVQQQFVPGFLQSTKCKLFLSGHAHAFEHFKHGGKDFLVIGGGGGPLHRLLTGAQQRTPDLYSSTENNRMFHYITCRYHRMQLLITVKMIKKDISGFENDAVITIE